LNGMVTFWAASVMATSLSRECAGASRTPPEPNDPSSVRRTARPPDDAERLSLPGAQCAGGTEQGR
jgi:hypothetical protein